MDIRWLSPTDIESTEIARYSSQILPVLAQQANIYQVTSGVPGEQAMPSWWEEFLSAGADTSESSAPGVSPIPIYHIGNNALHIPIYELSKFEPGVVVLHDLNLIDLARSYGHSCKNSGEWLDMMYKQYGDAGLEVARCSEKSGGSYFEMASEYPLFEPFVKNALGVVVHSRYAFDIVKNQLPQSVPVIQVNLPWPEQPVSASRNYLSQTLQLVFCGHVGTNRRLPEFFEAWSKMDFPDRIRLSVYGKTGNARQLERLAEHWGISSWVNFHGYVDDNTLDEALREAHFALNLRWPTMGETSASQLRFWSAGIPTLVTDVGWYAELPDTVVCKISPDNEVQNITAWLNQIVESPERYRAMSLAGSEYLAHNHSPEIYATKLVEFAQLCSESRLAYSVLENYLVGTIAEMCDSASVIRLFKQPVDVAVAMFEKQNIERLE